MKLSSTVLVLSDAERSALLLDGSCFPSYCMVDECDDWRIRSKYVLKAEKWPMILTGLSAVWALGAGPEPALHTASLIPPYRIRIPRNSRIVMEERSLSRNDYWQDTAHGVTTPLRTIYDLLRSSDATWATAQESVSLLLDEFSYTPDLVRTYILASGILPNKRQALSRIESWGYPSETR